ncbi:MAG: hypothetical protein EOO02_01050 [Chitinophagaceae bacterium]|nr:MAG: hypothetical protein EOO02_01050 [Chitinophagaceae bacterium]
MKTLIFPCNGATDSLDMIRTVIDIFSDEPVNCIFLEVRTLPDNYNDLMTLSRKRANYQGFTTVFTEALKELCSNCPADSVFSIDHIYGDSAAVFRNYADHRAADIVVFDHSQWKNATEFSGKDIFRMVIRCGCEIIYVSSTSSTDQAAIHLNSPKVKMIKETSVTGNRGYLFEPSDSAGAAPSSVKQKYQSVDSMLNELETNISRNRILTKKIGNLSRYFLKEISLQKMLSEAESTVLWIK